VIVNYLESEWRAVEVVHATQDNGGEAMSHRADITDEEAVQSPSYSSSGFAGVRWLIRLVECTRAIREQACGGTLGTTVRAISESDHEKVTCVVNEWWEGRYMAWLLPRLFFRHSASFLNPRKVRLISTS
jgi:hypothetical protein